MDMAGTDTVPDLAELAASSSSDCSLLTEKQSGMVEVDDVSLLTEKQPDMAEVVGVFKLDTSCGGLEKQSGMVEVDDVSLLTEKQPDMAEVVDAFQLDTSCGGLEIRVGLADKEFAADLSKKAMDLRSTVTSTAHTLQTSVLSSLGLDPQREAGDGEEKSIFTLSSNASSMTQSTTSLELVHHLFFEKSQELGVSVASNLRHLYLSVLSKQPDLQSLYLHLLSRMDPPITKQAEKTLVDPATREVPW